MTSSSSKHSTLRHRVDLLSYPPLFASGVRDLPHAVHRPPPPPWCIAGVPLWTTVCKWLAFLGLLSRQRLRQRNTPHTVAEGLNNFQHGLFADAPTSASTAPQSSRQLDETLSCSSESLDAVLRQSSELSDRSYSGAKDRPLLKPSRRPPFFPHSQPPS
ncbi:hypothetical protein L226DRAFT_98647 [Lentinus tigrinus ALCF2SS1-7]|uniref:uncharacterized protein n=1 Tax=Lentinus tigrinus ALCF2SS1-7 TaxID=1328758 RepID=UPI0011663E11|nr:hypothetical protein L226DRAFT_98647 [Lentinus tigrinus ALCF2SS1-7]